MKLQELIRQVYYEPSLILPASHASIRQLLESRLGDGTVIAREPGKDWCGEEVEVEQAELIEGIGHIPINGAIGFKLDPFERGSGAVDTRDVMDEIEQFEHDDDCRAIFFEVGSPGGMVTGTPELGERVRQIEKPCMAFTDDLMCSAAYWAMAGCDAIYATRTASVGSIGVYLPVYDESKRYEKAGIHVELIKAGKLKGIGFPGTILSEAAREHLQERVNKIYTEFKSHVRTCRGESIADSVMQGQTFYGQEAESNGLIDGVVKNKSEVLEML